MKINYNEKNYNIEQITGDIYRLYGNDLQIKFSIEFRNGLYFKIWNVTKNNRCYEAQRYHYKYIPLIREASFMVWKNEDIYDYENKCFVNYKKFIKTKNNN